ncbi:hypothetical protein [Teichococcus aerofrigidensis]
MPSRRITARLTFTRSISVRAITAWVESGSPSPGTARTRHSGMLDRGGKG